MSLCVRVNVFIPYRLCKRTVADNGYKNVNNIR